MQVIPGIGDITTGMHIFETPDDIIINSQIYNKSTLEPRPYCFYSLSTLNNRNLLKNTVSIVGNTNGRVTKEEGYASYIQDSEDPEIFYVINEQVNNTDQYFMKIQKTQDSYVVLHSAIYGATKTFYYWYNYNNLKFLAQTKEYIVLYAQGEGDEGSGTGYSGSPGGWRGKGGNIITIKKSDLTVTTLHLGGEREIFIQAIDQNINGEIVWILLRWGGNIMIGPYNVATNTLRWVWQDTSGTYYHNNCPGLSNVIKFRGYYTIMTNNSGLSGYQFQMFSINFETETVTRTIRQCDSHAQFPAHGLDKSNKVSAGWLIFTLKNIDDNYIAVTVHNDENGTLWSANSSTYLATMYSDKGYHRHVVYEYDANNDIFKPQDVIDMGNDRILLYGVLYYDPYTCVFLSDTSFQFWKFNPSKRKYEKGYERSGTFYTLGFDAMRRFYAIDSQGKCKIYTNITACLLDAQFEKQSYNYDGRNPISTYITVYAKNFVLDYISTQVTLTLSGSCMFENGSKSYTFTTPKAEINIPVIVTDGGAVYCHIKQTEVG